MLWLSILVGVLAAVLLLPALRQLAITGPVFALFKKIQPAMSSTETDALEAGTVWWEGELFSGKPRWEKLLAYPQPQLTPMEQSFLDNECAELCRLTNDWEATQVHQDLSPAAWQFIKDKGFLGMIIPRQYGGLEFSAYAHSQIVQKLSSRSSAAAVSVMVPNSLGPAELLLRYGTAEQKNHYLPRLAKGQEVPAFALTNPHAGSDAAAIPDTGIVCMGEWQGQQVLGMRVTWEKRYITLGPVCTLLGLAFHLHDPDHLLGDIEDIGITCALVPSGHPGVHIGRRHWPLNAVFQNGPNWGQDVFMPLDWIIGGPAMAGHGWRMVMECLAAGRAISLPSTSTGIAKLAVRATGGYARVRSQFNLAIGKFEGVEEALARMGGNTYLMDAARRMTTGAVDLGEHPSVASAIVKYHVTERARGVVNDAMDVLGGKGICLGPNNFMARAYQQIPIAITVEGANILTRSLIIFGQGAIRCHPFVLAEMQATQHTDAKAGLRAFDGALAGHVAFAIGNALRALWLGLTGSHFVGVPASVAPETKRYYQQLTRFSAAFAFLSDVSMLVLGGGLKRREKLSARLGDILSQMYLASATLKRYQDEGCQAADAPLMHWAIRDAMFRAQQAFEGVLANFPNKPAAWLLARIIFPLGRPYVVPADELGHEVAKCLITPSATRDRLTDGMYLPQNGAEASDDAVGLVELALAATLAAEPAEAKLRAAVKKVGAGGTATNSVMNERERLHQAQQTGVLTAAETTLVAHRYDLRDKVIRVDDFAPDFSAAAHG
ncbi:MAG: acyl-CoA dehydrogenase [Rugosibacter sp.]